MFDRVVNRQRSGPKSYIAIVHNSLILAMVVLAALGSAHGVYASAPSQVMQVKATVTIELVGVAGVCGDQNNDGAVNLIAVIIDLQITVGAMVATCTRQVLSDLNQDGVIDVFDAIMGLQFQSRLHLLPICELPVRLSVIPVSFACYKYSHDPVDALQENI